MQQAGADVQGRKLNTALINSTIDRLNAHGGGTLFFPAGTYLTGSIHMKSNITLELEAGATLKFSENFDDFLPYVEVRHEGIMMKSFQPLIYAVDAENITIKGEGTLDGQGKAWWTEFFRVLVDLRDNGKRNINKYQPMFEKENDLKALYAETNEDWHGTFAVRGADGKTYYTRAGDFVWPKLFNGADTHFLNVTRYNAGEGATQCLPHSHLRPRNKSRILRHGRPQGGARQMRRKRQHRHGRPEIPGGSP